ncbi:glycerol-3-phosphate responsive antiterminator [Thermoanaerobacterium thermosaccharolyticum]|nr:glycerol-3-phosphate responsive antiterminator [Thermoanaerobacterium thermosaccharolyticum]
MVKTKEDVINALSSGAVAVSTSEKSLWFID